MSNSDEQEEPVIGGDGSGGDDLPVERRVAHLKVGYDNSQSVVRFLDTKATAAAGIVPVVLGVCVAVVKWVAGDGGWFRISNQNSGIAILMLLAMLGLGLVAVSSIICGAMALWRAFDALMPRDVGKSQPSVLFPYAMPWFKERVELFVRGGRNADELEDYEEQVIRMSQIVEIKMTAVNRAVKHMRVFLASSIVFIAGLGLLRFTVWIAGVLAQMLKQ